MRHGDVQTLAAGSLELAHRLFEFLRRDLQKFVLNALFGLEREKSMDDWRATVGDRVSDNAIAINSRHFISQMLKLRSTLLFAVRGVYLVSQPASGVNGKIREYRVGAGALDAQ